MEIEKNLEVDSETSSHFELSGVISGSFPGESESVREKAFGSLTPVQRWATLPFEAVIRWELDSRVESDVLHQTDCS